MNLPKSLTSRQQNAAADRCCNLDTSVGRCEHGPGRWRWGARESHHDGRVAIGAPHNVPRRDGNFDGWRKNGTVRSTSIGRGAIDAECKREGAAELTVLQFKSPGDIVRAGRQSNVCKGRKG